MQKSANRDQFFTIYGSKGARFLQKVARLSVVFNVFFRGVSQSRPLPWGVDRRGLGWQVGVPARRDWALRGGRNTNG